MKPLQERMVDSVPLRQQIRSQWETEGRFHAELEQKRNQA